MTSRGQQPSSSPAALLVSEYREEETRGSGMYKLKEMFRFSNKTIPVKIRLFNQNKKYGVAAKDVKELLRKSCNLLQIAPPGAQLCLYEDGTIITAEFFPTLPDNTELVLLPEGQTWSGVVCDIGQLLNTDRHADGLIEAARELLSDEKSSKKRKILTDLLKNLEDRSELESREDDQEWFKGVDSRFKTKSAYMKYNCENRIRGYMKELDEANKHVKQPKVKVEFLKTSKCLADMLKEAKYNGSYFDRTEKEPKRLCTQEGWFTCQGSFDENMCRSLHSINPYSSRESRIIFSTWNLDHRIEKKREIIPTLLEALQNHRSSDVNLTYFYRLLFTRENLKLVHIVCHNKAAHNLQCDSKRVFNNNADKAKQKPRVKKRRKT